MSIPSVLCCGIIVADHVCTPIHHLPAAGELVLADKLLLTIGGCAANVSVNMTKLGVAAGVVGKVGDDVFGRIVADMLREQRVDVSLVQVAEGCDTSQTLIVNVAGQDRRFIHTFGANARFQASDFPLEHVKRCKVLYLGGYLIMDALTSDGLAAVFAAAQAAGVVTILDVVTPGPGDYLPRLRDLLPHVDVFLPNNHEAELILGERDPLRQAEQFHELRRKTAIVTLGENGAILVGDKARLRAAAYSMPFVDGSGGGDAFAAGYIAGLLAGLDMRETLRMASAVGASCVRAVGTTTGVFTQTECQSFLQSNPLRIEDI